MNLSQVFHCIITWIFTNDLNHRNTYFLFYWKTNTGGGSHGYSYTDSRYHTPQPPTLEPPRRHRPRLRSERTKACHSHQSTYKKGHVCQCAARGQTRSGQNSSPHSPWDMMGALPRPSSIIRPPSTVTATCPRERQAVATAPGYPQRAASRMRTGIWPSSWANRTSASAGMPE